MLLAPVLSDASDEFEILTFNCGVLIGPPVEFASTAVCAWNTD